METITHNNTLNNNDLTTLVDSLITTHQQFTRSSDFERTFDLLIHKAEEIVRHFPHENDSITRHIEEIYYIFAYSLKDKIDLEIRNNEKIIFGKEKFNHLDVTSRITNAIMSTGKVKMGVDTVELIVNHIVIKIREQKLLKESRELYLQMGNSLKKIHSSKFYQLGQYSLLSNTLKTNQKEIIQSTLESEGVVSTLGLIPKNIANADKNQFYENIKDGLLLGERKDGIITTLYEINWYKCQEYLGYLGALKTPLFDKYKDEMIDKFEIEMKPKIYGMFQFKERFKMVALFLILVVLMGQLYDYCVKSFPEYSKILIYAIVLLTLAGAYVIYKMKIWSLVAKFKKGIQKQIEMFERGI